jgi:hypothetical protein
VRNPLTQGLETEDRLSTRLLSFCGVSSLALVLILGGCGSPSSRSTGVVTGVAQQCTVALNKSGQLVTPEVNLGVHRGNVLVASERIPLRTTYRFTLPPGRYVISESLYDQRYPVVVRKGKTVHMDLPRLLCD